MMCNRMMREIKAIHIGFFPGCMNRFVEDVSIRAALGAKAPRMNVRRSLSRVYDRPASARQPPRRALSSWKHLNNAGSFSRSNLSHVEVFSKRHDALVVR